MRRFIAVACSAVIALCSILPGRSFAKTAMTDRTGMHILFYGQPPADSPVSAIRWALHTLASAESLRVGLNRDFDGDMIFFADSNWAGVDPVPCGIVDATATGWWVAPGMQLPVVAYPLQAVSFELPSTDPEKLVETLMERSWTKSTGIYPRSNFALHLDDGNVVEFADTSLVVETRWEPPDKWYPLGICAFGGVIRAEFVASDNPAMDRAPESDPLILPVQNPCFGSPSFIAKLAPRREAQVELFDVQGRCIAKQSIHASSEPERRVTFGRERLATGVYWARLTQGDKRSTARIAVVR